jgi:HEAT repeat protein
VFIGGLSAAAITDSKDTEATNKETLKNIEEPSRDSQQQDYIQQLQNPQAEIRATAVAEIEPVGDALYVLTDMLLKDPSPGVRIATSEALEDSDDPLAVAALVKCLQDEDPAVIVQCIESLDLLGDKTTVVHLQPLLTHYHPGVNTAAAEAIEALQ